MKDEISPLRRRTIPERLDYMAEKLTEVVARNGSGGDWLEVLSHATTLRMTADELREMEKTGEDNGAKN